MNYIMNNLINLDENNTFHKLKNNETHEIIVDFSQNPYGELMFLSNTILIILSLYFLII